MNDEVKRKYDEMQEEAERIMEEVNRNPDLRDVKAPAQLREKIFMAIREKEEERELIHLGRIYKRKRKNRKYLILAAAMLLVLACGVTCMGGAEKIFETFKIMTMGRKQVQVNSNKNIIPSDSMNEEQVYEKIEATYGFYPVRLNYLPKGVAFEEVEMGDEILGIQMTYCCQDKPSIIYMIRPNYRNGSLGQDVEDELIEEYQKTIKGVVVTVRKYLVEDETERWTVQFEYGDVQYSMLLMNMEEQDVVDIVENLYFPVAKG